MSFLDIPSKTPAIGYITGIWIHQILCDTQRIAPPLRRELSSADDNDKSRYNYNTQTGRCWTRQDSATEHVPRAMWGPACLPK